MKEINDLNYAFLIFSAFDELLKCRTIQEVDDLQNKLFKEIKLKGVNTKQYPKISFAITKGEIEGILGNSVTEDYKISPNLIDAEPLTKLLYAVLWKNGDLQKVKHIIKGIMDEEPEASGLVFHQFGKYLTKKSEPIIDQHVLRAYGIYFNRNNDDKMKEFRYMSVIDQRHAALIKCYKNWLTRDLAQELMAEEDYAYHVDKFLFALGKAVKGKPDKIFNNVDRRFSPI